jgi:hypothetical protein
MRDTYQILVGGHLDDRWADWFDGLTVQRQDDGTTLLMGAIVDQAALHGVIARIRDLALPLLSVQRMESSLTCGDGSACSDG